MKDINEIKEKILAVDDDEDYLNLMVLHLTNNNYQVIGVTDPEEALGILEEQVGEISVLVTDWMMPKLSGNELILKGRQIDPLMEAIITTSFPKMGAIGVKSFGANEYLTKPLESMNELSEAVERAIAHRKFQIQNQNSKNGSQPGDNVRNLEMKNK